MPDPAPPIAREPADELLTCAAEVQDGAPESRTFSFVASSEAIDSYGDCVLQDWDLTRYERNPVCFLNHNSRDLPIGSASRVRVEGGRLLADVTIVDDDAHPQASFVMRQLQKKTLRAVSVGFLPRDVRIELRNGVEVCVLGRCELFEISLAGVPANPETLMRMRARAARSNTSRSTAAALPHTEVPTMKFIALAAKLGIAAPTEEAAEAGLLALAEEGAQVRATLGTKSAGDTAARVAELSIAAVELPKIKAELAALEAVEKNRAAAERTAHIDAIVEAQPHLKDARDALEAFATADYARFCKKHPKPANTARERALTERVVPGGGATGEVLTQEREAPALAGAEALLEAADHVARELMAKDKTLTYAVAFKQASLAIRDARQTARS